MQNNTDAKELQEFLQEAISQIKEGTKGHYIDEPVNFEVAVVKTTTAGGKMGIKVIGLGNLGGGAEVKTENVSKMKFKVRIRDDEDENQVGSFIAGSSLLEELDQY